MNEILQRLRGGFVVSVQAQSATALDDPHVLAAMAAAAVEGGAAAVRIQGVANLHAVRARVAVPVAGLIKRSYDGFEPYITPTIADVREVVQTGAEIVAFDATARRHPDDTTIDALVKEIHAAGRLAMADCALASDGVAAAKAGADIIATTLAGYTRETQGRPLPALDLLRSWAGLGVFRICEGGVHSPESAAQAMEAGADAVVVGTAITNIAWVTRNYVQAVNGPARPKSSQP